MQIDNTPPRGTRDLLPATVTVRDHVLGKITEVYHRYWTQFGKSSGQWAATMEINKVPPSPEA